MALLKAPRTQVTGRIAGLLALLSVAGCMLINGSNTRAKFAFNHAEHVVEQGLACVNCHADAGRSDQPGMPAADACGVCHDELDAAKPIERQVRTLFEGETFKAQHVTRLAGEVVFSHARHTASIQDCALCHEGIATNERITSDVRFTMDACTTCHAERAAKSECATCHRELRADVAPPSHLRDWKRAHGRCARSPSDATADRCELCHTESTCVQCHREEAPANHTVHWRLRGHGISAMMDRSGCAVCHQEDSCVQCHSESVPRNHTASFGSPRDTHCVACHMPLRNEGCVACHANTNSHRMAPQKPRDPVHVSGQNCRQCHGLFAPLMHVDNGDDCNACHH